MNVLVHGMPFFRHPRLLRLYRGVHAVRSLSACEDADFRYDPARETLRDVLERIGQTWRPDLLLFWFPENDPPPMGVEDAPIPTVAMAGDWNLFYPCLRLNLARYDHVLCDKGAVSILTSDMVHPVHLFPLYAQDSVLHRPCAIEKDIDILFAGCTNFARYHERGRWCERLARLGARYRVAIVDGCFGETYNTLLNRARIVFNHSVRGELNLRTFETLSAGSLAFVEADNVEVRDWLCDGEDVVLYMDDNFEARVAYYLEHRGEAEAIAARGHARAPEFTIENRLDAVIDWAATHRAAPRSFRELPPLEQAVQTFMMYHGTQAPAYMGVEQQHMALIARMAPEDPRVWAATGRCLLMPKSSLPTPERADLAIKTLQRAATLAPDSAPCAFNLVAAYTHVGRRDETEPLLWNVLQCQQEELSEFLIGWIHAPRAFWPHCRMWNRSLIALARKQPILAILHAEAHVRLAEIEAKRRVYDVAIEHLERARELDPENISRATLLADVFWQTGRREESVDLLWSQRDSYFVDVAFRDELLAKLDAVGDSARRSAYAEETSAIRATLTFSDRVAEPNETVRGGYP